MADPGARHLGRGCPLDGDALRVIDFPKRSALLLVVAPAILMCAWAITWPLFPALNAYNCPPELAGPVISTFYVAGAAVVIYRYRHTANPQQRQQMKWVIYSMSLAVLLWPIGEYPRFALETVLSARANSLALLAAGMLIVISQLLVPLAFGLAILRYRLWDIDIIIDRTLVYLPLTGILAGAYAASIALLQRVFQTFTGQKSGAAVVITTLLLVGVFSPIKDALQHLVERRYRETNDPTALLRAFGQHVRSVADIFDARRMTEQALETAAAALGAPGGDSTWRGAASCGWSMPAENGRRGRSHSIYRWRRKGCGWVACNWPRGATTKCTARASATSSGRPLPR